MNSRGSGICAAPGGTGGCVFTGVSETWPAGGVYGPIQKKASSRFRSLPYTKKFPARPNSNGQTPETPPRLRRAAGLKCGPRGGALYFPQKDRYILRYVRAKWQLDASKLC